MAFLSPRAERYGNTVARRLENKALRAFDRFKLEQEDKETERLMTMSRVPVDDRSITHSEDETMYDIYGGIHIDAGEIEEDLPSVSTKEFGGALCGKTCSKLFTPSNRNYILTWWEYLPILIFLNTSITFNINCIELSVKWGAIMVLVTFIAVQILIASPLFMAYMFLASYSRRSYIRIWDAVPLMKGLGYSIALTLMVGELFNISFTGLAMYYLYLLIIEGDIPWKNCNFPSANRNCIFFNETETKVEFLHNGTCCPAKICGKMNLSENSAKYASLDYYMSYVLQEGYEQEPLHFNLLTPWMLAVIIIWIILYFCMTIGLRKTRKFFCVVDMVLLITIVPAILVTIILSPDYEVMDEMETSFSNILNSKMWLDFVEHYLYKELPGDVIALSSVSLPAVSTTSDTVIVFTCKIVWGAMSVVWTSIMGKFLVKHYKIKDDICVMVRGDFVFFAMIPDALSWAPTGHLNLVIYFSIVILWNLSIIVFVFNNSIEAILDELPILNRFRALIVLPPAVILCAFNIHLLRPNFMAAFETYIGYTFPGIVGCQLMAAWMGIFFYSIKKLSEDYHFTFGQKLSNYWILGLKLGLVVFCVLAKLLYDQSVVGNGAIWLYIVLIWPIPIGMIVMVLRYYMRINTSLIDAPSTWGPPTKRKRCARVLFDPLRDLKYKSNVRKCKHHCLVQTSAVKREIKHWQARFDVTCMILMEDDLFYSKSVQDLKSLDSLSIND